MSNTNTFSFVILNQPESNSPYLSLTMRPWKTDVVTVLSAGDCWALNHKWDISIIPPRPRELQEGSGKTMRTLGWRGVCHETLLSTCGMATATTNRGEHCPRLGPQHRIMRRGAPKGLTLLGSYWLLHVDDCYRRKCRFLWWIHCETYQNKIASFGGVKKKYMDGEELGTVKVESFIIIRPW